MLSSSLSLRRAIPTGFSLCALVLAATAQAQTTALGQVKSPDIVRGATLTGRLPAATVLSLSISLQPDRNRLAAYANGVSDRSSPNYHRFITPAQVGERFGPSKDTVNATLAFLKSKGMTIKLVADNRMAILFGGRADKVENAFATRLMTYRFDARTDGGPKRFYSFTTTPKVPTTIAPKVVSITGLENAYAPMPRSTLSPSQTRTLYNAAALYGTVGRKGEGVNVGITNFDGYRLSNLPLFYSTFDLATPDAGVGSNIVKVSVDGFDGEQATPGTEGDLDIQLALAIAPRCTLYVYDSNDYVATAVRQANDNLVDIVSESWGHLTNESRRAQINAAHDQHLAMTAQGITYVVPTGDFGTDLLGFDYPNFDPEILQVGGSVATVDAAGNRVSEVGWNGSGSGWSTFDIDFNTLPSWLKGDTVPTNINRRIFPDLALHADGAVDGSAPAYSFVFNGAVSAVSGTSASAPTFAGQLALILQELHARGAADLAGNGRPRLGRINDFVYALNGDPTVFLDLLGGDAGQLPDGTQAVGKVGWDFVTGWGAPDSMGLLEAFFNNASIPLEGPATSAVIFATNVPNRTYGTSPRGGVDSLPTADGNSYSVQAIRQVGVGQVAAVAIDFVLRGESDRRRSVSVKLVVEVPNPATGFLYAYNFQTDSYDVLKTITGTGTPRTVDIRALDLTKYVENDTLRIIVRALKPTRLGPASFRLGVDQAVATERVAQK